MENEVSGQGKHEARGTCRKRRQMQSEKFSYTHKKIKTTTVHYVEDENMKSSAQDEDGKKTIDVSGEKLANIKIKSTVHYAKDKSVVERLK